MRKRFDGPGSSSSSGMRIGYSTLPFNPVVAGVATRWVVYPEGEDLLRTKSINVAARSSQSISLGSYPPYGTLFPARPTYWSTSGTYVPTDHVLYLVGAPGTSVILHYREYQILHTVQIKIGNNKAYRALCGYLSKKGLFWREGATVRELYSPHAERSTLPTGSGICVNAPPQQSHYQTPALSPFE